VRYLAGAHAAELVAACAAAIHNENGRVRSIKLLETAASHAVRIGEASAGRPGGVRFYRWVYLEQSGARIVEFHPRSFDWPP
jgi:hypothetical protein